jgi:proteic killer suppression protein
VIKSFRDRDTRQMFNRLPTRRWRGIARQARRKLEMLNAARSLNELRIPPGNRLESLKRGRRGQHSIRINDQWRICFVWRGGDAYDVEITDYH